MASADTFRRNVLQLHGTGGADWLARIPELLQVCAANWSLSLGAPYPDSSYSYVVVVTQPGGDPAVLKLSFPNAQLVREAAALRAFAGRASIALLAYDSSVGAMLLQRAEPGHQLAQLCESEDERATSIAGSIACMLTREVPSCSLFPSVETWSSDIQSIANRLHVAPQLRALASHAAAVAGELAKSFLPKVLLHGDLHQFNILAAGETWLAIDPSGIIGERECEIGPLVLNPVSLLRRPGLSELISRRINQLCAEMRLDRRRAHAWTFVRAVLAILWSLEDHAEAPPEWIECAQSLKRKAG